MVKMYDSLMKSGRFTAAQNKAENGEYLDSVSELVAICEKEGFIPRFYTDIPKDRVDETILDMKNYTHDLVFNEMNLGNLIENAVKEMTQQENKTEDVDDEDDGDNLTLANVDGEIQIVTDKDYEEYSNFTDDEAQSDEELIRAFMAATGEEE